MHKLVTLSLFAALVVSCSAIVAHGQEALSYRDAVKACGAEWRASDERKAVQKGEGQKAWNAFRAVCVKRVGYVSKRSKAN